MVGRTIKKWWPIFVLPTFAAFVIGFLWPFIWGIYLSFCKFTTVNDVTFVGFSNYSKILLDNTFSHSFWLTVVFAFVSSILINVLAFSIALVLTKGYRGTNAFRTVFFMPNLIGGIVLGYIWQTLLNGLLSKWGQPLLSLSARNGCADGTDDGKYHDRYHSDHCCLSGMPETHYRRCCSRRSQRLIIT